MAEVVKHLEEMTQEGYNKLVEELEYRRVVVRDQVAERLKVARSFGDLSENSEYDEAKTAHSENENRIVELEKILKGVSVLDSDEISKTKVGLGAVVTLRDEQSQEINVYTIVNPREEDIFENKISTESPVGQALLGKKRGQVIEVKTSMGHWNYKIIKIGK